MHSRSWKWTIALLAILAFASCGRQAPTSLVDQADMSGMLQAVDKAELQQQVESDETRHVVSGTAGRMERVSGGNPYYTVYVEDGTFRTGTYTVGTGPAHPVTLATGSPQNVLYGGSTGSPWTSYTTIRSYSSGTEYTQVSGTASAGFVARDLSYAPHFTVPVGPASVFTSYQLAPLGRGDPLKVDQLVQVNGTTFDDSSVEVTTSVTNLGPRPVDIGIRYLWDFQIGWDDGPTMAPQDPTGPTVYLEHEYRPPGFGFYEIEDNDGNVTSPLFSVFGTVTGPSSVTPTPSGADVVSFVAWALSYNRVFDYAANPAQNAANSGAYNDSAVLIYRGSTLDDAVRIPPGGTFVFSHSLVSALPGEAPPPYETPEENEAPTADAGGPYNGNEGAAIAFDGSGSSDPEGTTLAYDWDFGDGSTGTGVSPSHTYADNGTYTATVTVTDEGGLSDSAGVQVDVYNVAPLVSTGPNTSIYSGESYDLTGTFSDPGVADDAWQWEIDWADGSAPQTGSTNDQGASILDSHQYLAAGEYQVRFSVTDKDGDRTTAATWVTVERIPLVIDIKPGSDVNSIHLGSGNQGRGKADQAGASIAVAIFSTADMDATALDPALLYLGDLAGTETPVAMKKNGSYFSAPEDVDGDGRLDLVVHFDRSELIANGDLVPTTVRLYMTGDFPDGRQFIGDDGVRIVP